MSEQPKPPPDTSWIEMEEIGHPVWPLFVAFAVIALAAVGYCWWVTL